MLLELNITNEEKLLLTSNAFVTSLSICNTGATDLVLGLYKLKQNSVIKFYFLKDVTLKRTHTFLAEDMVISEEDSFYISVGSGSCSVIIDYT
jgi:hypothetical protein